MWNSFKFIFIKNPTEIESLNGLRAVSILGILIQHLWLILRYGHISSPHLVDNLFTNFVNFIDLFFVLSGFLIYGSLSREFEKEKHIKYSTYFKKRTLRIFPAYYFFVTIMYLFAYFQIKSLSGKPSLTETEIEILALLKGRIHNFYTDFLYISNYFGGNITHNWSLAIEEQFYIILPFFLTFFMFKLKREFRIFWFIGLYFLPLIIRSYVIMTSNDLSDSHLHIYSWTHTRIDSLLVGIIVYEIYSTKNDFFKGILDFRLYLYPIIILIAAFAFLIDESEHVYIYNTVKYNLSNLTFGFLVLIALDSTTLLSKFFSQPIFRPIARLSYTTYLWHILFAGAMFRNFIHIEKHFTWIRYSYACVVTIFLTFLLSWFMFALIEYPFLKKKMLIS